VANLIPGLPRAQMVELLPLVFQALKDDGAIGDHAALALYTASGRQDSGEILKPYMKDIAALFGRDARFKATADFVLMRMQPQPPEAAGILLSFINGPTGTVQEKIDALSAASHLTPHPGPQFEAAAIRILKQPLNPATMHAAINAAQYPGATGALADVFAEKLDHAEWQVRMQAVLAIGRMGPAIVAKHRGVISKLANDQSQPEPVRNIAQNTLDGKDERCFTLQGGRIQNWCRFQAASSNPLPSRSAARAARLASRKGNTFKSFRPLKAEIGVLSHF